MVNTPNTMGRREKIMGITTITHGYRISLLKDVKQHLESTSGTIISEGDKIVYFLNERGELVIRLA